MKKGTKAILAGLGILAAAQTAASAGLFFFAFYHRRLELPEKWKAFLDKLSGRAQKELNEDYRRLTAQRNEGKEWLKTQYKKTEEIILRNKEDILLHGTMLLAEKPTDQYLIAVHGYRGQGKRDYAAYARFYHELGVNLLMVDNRGHRPSEGDFIGFGWKDKDDIVEWCEYLVRRSEGKARIALLGISMGAAAVMMASGEKLPGQVRCIVEDCGYTTAWDQFDHVYPRPFPFPKKLTMLIASGICKLVTGYGFKEYSSLKQLAKNKRPMLFIHGGEDDYVPTRMVYELVKATKGPSRLVVIEGAAHALSGIHDPERYQREVREFLEEYL